MSFVLFSKAAIIFICYESMCVRKMQTGCESHQIRFDRFCHLHGIRIDLDLKLCECVCFNENVRSINNYYFRSVTVGNLVASISSIHVIVVVGFVDVVVVGIVAVAVAVAVELVLCMHRYDCLGRLEVILRHCHGF